MNAWRHTIASILMFICYSLVCLYFDQKTIFNNADQKAIFNNIDPNMWYSVSEVVFPLIFGYFLDYFGRKNCLAMLTLSIIIPGFSISLLGAYLQSISSPSDSSALAITTIGNLFLQSGLQSMNVVFITSLFLHFNNIFIFPIVCSAFNALQSALGFLQKEQRDIIMETKSIVISVFVVNLMALWYLWHLEQEEEPAAAESSVELVQPQIKTYLLNVYFGFAVVQSVNFALGNLSVRAALSTFTEIDHTKQLYQNGIHIVQTIAYTATLIVLIFTALRPDLVLMTQSFIADLVMSFGILFLKISSLMGGETETDCWITQAYTRGIACVLVTMASYVFCTSSYLMCLRSYNNKGVAVGTVLSLNRFIRLIVDSWQPTLDPLIWISILVLVVEKLVFLLIGFYDSHRFQILFTASKDFVRVPKQSIIESF